MDGKRRWFGWVAIGLGALALAVALLERGFGAQMGAAGQPGAYAQQSAQQADPAARQNAGPQAGPGVQQQNAGPQNGPGANVQQQSAGRRGGPAGPGGEARRGGGRPGDGGFGMGGWLRMPFWLIGGSFQWVMLALLIGLGMWMIRRRNSVAAPTSGRAEPAQSAPSAPLSPTGEAYTEEPSEQE